MKKVMLCVAAVLLAGSVSFGAVIANEPQVSISWQDENGDNGGSWSMVFGLDHELRTGDAKSGSISLFETDKYDLAGSGIQWFNMAFDADPYVIGGFAVINGTNAVMTYTVIFTSPVFPAVTPSTLYGGSMSGSFTADNTAATVTTTAQTPLYWGMIDGAPLLAFYSDPQSWTTPAFNSGDIAPVSVLPPMLVGPAANNNISIQFKFTLTPGDTATMNGVFVVIPEPATLVLLGVGGFLVRRKK